MTHRFNKTHRLALILGALVVLTLAGCAADDSDPLELTGTQACPAWVYFPANFHSNEDSPYLGCVNHVNLVNMLEAPADLDTGRPIGPTSGERETIAVKDYDLNKTAAYKDPNAPTGIATMLGVSGGTNQ